MSERGKARCPFCEKVLTPFVPTNGDGSASVLRSHNGSDGQTCLEGWAHIVEASEWVEEPR